MSTISSGAPPLDYLVTGADGWLGRRLLDVLMDGLPDLEGACLPNAPRRVRALVLDARSDSTIRSQRSQASGVEVIVGDLRNPADCAKFCAGARGAVLFHTAGLIHPARVRDFYAVNVRGTENLLRAAAAAGVKRAVIVSSNSPCGCNASREQRFDESSPYHPYLNYGRSKMEMELLVRQLNQQGLIKSVVVRPPWFYGPFQPPRQTLFFRMIRDGKMPIVGDGNNVRSMIYVDNLCRGLLLAGSTPGIDGETYWMADRRPYTMNEIVDTIEHLLENEFGIRCAHKRLRLPSLASGVAYACDATLQSLGLYHQKIHVLSEMNKTIACSIDKAQEQLGYSPAVELEEGMRRSIRWCLEQGYLEAGTERTASSSC